MRILETEWNTGGRRLRIYGMENHSKMMASRTWDENDRENESKGDGAFSKRGKAEEK